MITRFDPFAEIKRLEDKIFNAYPTIAQRNDGSISSFMPVVNTREDDKAYYIEIDLPGVKKEDISVDISDGVLTVSGERKYKNEVKEENYYKIESSFGKFERSFRLPEDLDADAIDAKSEDGVLEITLPKKKKEESKKKIEIK
jgi:HSP20 family protein